MVFLLNSTINNDKSRQIIMQEHDLWKNRDMMIQHQEEPQNTTTTLLLRSNLHLSSPHQHSIRQTRTSRMERKDTLFQPVQSRPNHPPLTTTTTTRPFPAPIKVPFPIFVASLYKSGTTTIHAYFQCGGQRSVHWVTDQGIRTGKCFYENLQQGDHPYTNFFQGCGDYDIWTDNSFFDAPTICWDPSVTHLDTIYQHYPNATILLIVRDSFSWINSVIRWGKLYQRLQTCHNLWPEQPPLTKSLFDVEDIRQYYLWQIQHVRNFAATHPSMTYIEVSLEDNATASILEERIGIPASCWGRHNNNEQPKLTNEKRQALKELHRLQSINQQQQQQQ